ncbi:pilus assembly PilX N-terminal domain-containing protein [uncultured Desulfosarcina sp.]|uniref:pilus assembly PilX family protein n=1 Tax=uncultured Desulfosarcina sp. TaxID=218289 RepID=UPI0029C847C5|nr:pilus assembly PilX N-terminal domain-containing protein [uncultured Desulfosarcina sp.]
MTKSYFIPSLNDEEGIVTIVSLMVLVILTIAGIAAVTIANNETSIVRNEQIAVDTFYSTETGINDALVNYTDWLTDDFLTESVTVAGDEFDAATTVDDGDPVATIQVRCIEDSQTEVFDGDVGDEIPAMSHTASPPSGSGYSAKYFQIRRYSITSTSTSDGTAVQIGAWKVFNKS